MVCSRTASDCMSRRTYACGRAWSDAMAKTFRVLAYLCLCVDALCEGGKVNPERAYMGRSAVHRFKVCCGSQDLPYCITRYFGNILLSCGLTPLPCLRIGSCTRATRVSVCSFVYALALSPLMVFAKQKSTEQIKYRMLLRMPKPIIWRRPKLFALRVDGFRKYVIVVFSIKTYFTKIGFEVKGLELKSQLVCYEE